jgi:pimeloyl-ACP methyl ester carboxylesterase
VRRLVLLEGLGPLTDAEARAPERMRDALAAELAPRRAGERAGYPDFEGVVRRLAEATRMRESSARTLLRRGLRETPEGRWDWLADARLRLPSRLRMTEPQVEAYLRAIACPTLLVRAVPGMPADPAYFEGRAKAIADLTLVTRPGGHHLHLDAPEAVAAVVGPFLAGG